MSDPMAAPEEVHLLSGGAALELHWQHGQRSRIDSDVLRGACGCAACQALRQRGETVAGAGVTLTGAELAGVGALQLFFSDGHNRGRYPWRYLRDLAEPSGAGGD
tara:strand:- start:18128 stop:18442 length:315 start_codon:yes stop_codon:yes gene_type:complete